MLGPGAVFADRAGIAIGQVVQQRPGVTGKPVRLADPPSVLAGREDLLAELDIRLTGGDGSEPRTVALCGLGGAGKTSVALEYAHRHLAEVQAAWQLAAEDPAVLAAGFGELAAELGARDLFDTRNPVASVHGMLAAFPAEWLLIFDNVPDRASVQAFLPPAGPGRVLITSQNQNWPPGQALEVPVLGAEVTAEFLVNRTGDPDRQAALDLAGELGGLPLALEQAAAYMQATEDSLAEYLELFRERRPDMLTRGEPTGYIKTVATTWALAFRELGQAASGASGLLRLLAFCAPEAVPLRLLLQARPGVPERLGPDVAPVLVPLLEDPLAAKDAIAALRQHSLISPPVDGSVSVHPLVQAVTADQMSAELAAAWRQAAAAVIEATIPDDTDTPATWPVCAALLPHAQAALAADSDGLERLANYLGERGSYAAACDLLQRALDAERGVLGPDHPDTLATWHNLAHWTGESGDPAGARDQFAALLPVSELVLGADHPDTLADRYTLAYWAGKAGDPAGARDQFAALLPVRERVSGALDPSTLGARANVAHWTGEAGDPAGARDQFAALLPVDERVFGPDHPDTLSDRHELASWTGEAGDPAGARDQYAALLPVRERVLGPDHPHTLSDRHELARWTGEAGDPAGARDQFAALLPVLEQVLGPDHPRILDDRSLLADWTGKAGDPAGARDQFAALLPVDEQVLGTDHPRSLDDRSLLAYWTGKAGDPAGARDQFAALLPVSERVLGADHTDTLTIRHELAYWTGEAGDPAGARDQFAALLPVDERVFGPDHPHTLSDRHELATWAGEAGDPAGARDQYAALLPAREQVLGADHPRILDDRSLLAYWTGEAGDPAGARDQFAALLPVLEQVLGPDHPHTLATRGDLTYWTRESNRGELAKPSPAGGLAGPLED